ncbi:hypothetical protein M5M_06945 [Simiduia agarivorans SA1 = DSM 21679]|uniref:Membrane transport protein MMPL domain-containing protein n=1 Tax=Simiduia agarivorans (strain DSM 21679 / JCM 13881 / BCRC 17597 / SA1) TaxID=1117647 RepID=K4KHJ2_SIMAS|nr:hypothetical protein M5M_06945 [Simiduia agarivorans SA1 = DSM 21679]
MLAKGWLVLVLTAALSLIWRLPDYQFDTDLLALLPDHARSEWYDARIEADKHLAQLSSNRFLLAVGAADAETSLAAAEQVRRELADGDWRYIEPGRQAQQLWQSYWPHRYHLLATDDRQAMQSSPQAIIDAARLRLYAPVGDGRYDPVKDPLFLFQNFLQQQARASALQLDQGYPSRLLDGLHWRLLQYELSTDAFAQALTTPLPALVHSLRAGLPEGVQLLQSGMVFHAAHGAHQARDEISFIGLGSLLGVILVLAAAFGRSSLILLASLSAGLLIALVVSVWSFERLHLITLAFGASLIGVAIDYGIHARNGQQHGQTFRQLLPALGLGLFTSLVAYGLQAAVHMPGLTQMALFSCVGLAASWLSVVLWLPEHAESPSRSRLVQPLFNLADAWRQLAAKVPAFPRVSLGILVLALVSLLWLPGRDQVASLQTSTESMLAQEQALLTISQAPRPGRYFLVRGHDSDDLFKELQTLESALNAQGIESQSVRQWLPEKTQQMSDFARLSQFYQASLPVWFSALGAESMADEAIAAIAELPMTLDHVNAELAALYLLPSATLAFVYPEFVLTTDQLANLPQGSWTYVDRGAELSDLLAKYRHWLLLWVQVAMVVLTLTLWFRYGLAGALLLASPLVAAIAVLWLVAVMDGGVNLFHCLALLLVLGVGFDSSIFFARSPGPEAWRGASLSILTSLLAFGLLALCTTPVLKSFGTVAAYGLLLVWLLVPLMVQPIVKSDTE